MTNSRLLLVLSGSLFACHAAAQQAAVDHCKKSANDTARIVCLEAALLALEPAATQPADIAAKPVAEVTAEPEGIGADQVIARNQTKESLQESLELASNLTVVSYDTVPYEKMLVTLENGQVWKQIKGDTQVIRIDLKRNQTVDIEESSISGYKMHLNQMGRTVRVERVK